MNHLLAPLATMALVTTATCATGAVFWFHGGAREWEPGFARGFIKGTMLTHGCIAALFLAASAAARVLLP